MSVIVEDGTKVPNSNSYVDENDFIAYAAARGYVVDPSLATQWLTIAMDYLESLKFIGTKSILSQSLQWPRYNVVIDTWWVPYNTIPPQLIKVQCEIALQIWKGNDPLQDRPRRTQREKVNGIEVEYSPGASSIVLPVKITSLLWKLVVGGNVGGSFAIGRG